MDTAGTSAWPGLLALQNLSNPEVDGAEQKDGENVRMLLLQLAFHFQRDLRNIYGM